jgi:transposase-like protein
VEVLRRYSNCQDLVGPMIDVLRRIEQGDRTDEAGIFSTGEPSTTRRLTEAEREELVERFRGGTRIRILAEQYGVSESCVKRALRREGVGRYQRY